MTKALTTVVIRYEHDVVLARQRARQMAALLGFEPQDQVRIATAVSEIIRNVFRYAERGKAEFFITDGERSEFQIKVTDQGPGIRNLQEVLDGSYTSSTGMGMGILGARRLMDEFQIESSPAGTIVFMAKRIPSPRVSLDAVAGKIAAELARQPSENAFEEMRQQNQELLAALAEVERRQNELAVLNKELQDTNRGVVALYAELEERADYLRRASEVKTQFLSNMTHEFRTPLNSILSLSRILLDHVDGELNPEQQRQVKFIQKAANDLSEIVNDLLDLAKVEAGKITIHSSDFTVRDLFGALRGMLRPLLAGNSAIALVFEEAAEDLPPLHTDESKISQILRNLISNALKFTEAGEVRISARKEQDWIAISVADSGVGIALADQERIFEEFTQLEGPHQRGKRGTGLGLPLSRKLAGLLGGSLTVSSEPRVGSVFTLRVPATYKGPEEVTFLPEPTAELDPKRLPVLLVEDNAETLFVYEKYFKGTPFQPIPARTVSQAHASLRKCRPVAIVLDILLANESTWNFLSDLKQAPSTRSVPVLVVTMVGNQQKAVALGADAFREKPIDRKWLLDELAKIAPEAAPREVLLVDDDDASRYVLSGLFSGTAFQPIEAASGKEGLRLARERKPAAIFLDLTMPDMNGAKLLEALKADHLTSDIPVVIHTAKKLSSGERSKLEKHSVAIIDKNHADRQASLRLIHDLLRQTQTLPQAPIATAG